jgi:hypothetical protein
VSDLHCGSQLGLCPDTNIPFDNGGHYTPSNIQRWLWGHWLDFWRRVKKARQGAHLTILNVGDLVDGPEHHGTVEAVGRHPGIEGKILRMAARTYLDLKPDAVVVIRGTETHVGKSAAAEEAFAEWLKQEGHNVPGHASRGTASWWRFTGDFGKYRIDAAHHGRMGSRPWTKAGQVGNYAAQIFYEYATTQRRHPDIALRAHYHRMVDSYDAHPVRVIQMPAWQVATAYVYRIAPDSIADIGGIIITITGDDLDVQKVTYKPTEGTIWQAPAV